MDDHDFNNPDSLRYWAVLLEDPTTQITMTQWAQSHIGYAWEIQVSSPEGVKDKAMGNELYQR